MTKISFNADTLMGAVMIMMTSSNGSICRVTGPPVTGEFPAQRPATRSFDISFALRLNKRLSKHSWGWWSEAPSCPLWRHCNETFVLFNIDNFYVCININISKIIATYSFWFDSDLAIYYNYDLPDNSLHIIYICVFVVEIRLPYRMSNV